MESKSEKIKELLSRGVEKIIDFSDLKKRLLSGQKLRIKLGIDPTGPKIHLGRATVFWKLREFQDMGHVIVLIIGDFTAMIGDASDKKAMRKSLSPEEIKRNMKSYTEQIGKILDMSKVELHHNSEWLSKLKAGEIISIAQHFTAQQMIQRRNFKERWKTGKPIGLHELYYPIFQGYDSVAVKSDLEMGGFDQLFNLKVGREMQKIFGQKPQNIMTLQMLPGLDGRKMSTSWNNSINIIDKPITIYEKIMSMKDSLVFDYFKLCTRTPLSAIRKIAREVKEKRVTLKKVKEELALQIITLYYNNQESQEAKEEFDKIFIKDKVPSSLKKILIPKLSIRAIDLLMKTGLVTSRSEARRIISQGGVKIRIKNKIIPIRDWEEKIKAEKGMIIQIGKKRFAKII